MQPVAMPLDLRFPKVRARIIRKTLTKLVKRNLVAARACVEHQDLHIEYGHFQFLTSGISSPCSRTYCACSTNLSRRNCWKWAPMLCNLGTRSTTSPARWKRSRELTTAISNGVVV